MNKIQLQELEFYTGQSTQMADILLFFKQNINELDINLLPIAGWAF